MFSIFSHVVLRDTHTHTVRLAYLWVEHVFVTGMDR